MPVRARSTRHSAAVTLVGIGATALLGGCGMATRQQAAVVVNGTMISQADIAETQRQLADAQFKFSENNVVQGLIASPLLREAAAETGAWRPDQTYATALAAIEAPTQTTKDFIEAAALLESDQIDPSFWPVYQKLVNAAHVELNPRFGSFTVTEQSPLYFAFDAKGGSNWFVTNGATPAPATDDGK